MRIDSKVNAINVKTIVILSFQLSSSIDSRLLLIFSTVQPIVYGTTVYLFQQKSFLYGYKKGNLKSLVKKYEPFSIRDIKVRQMWKNFRLHTCISQNISSRRMDSTGCWRTKKKIKKIVFCEECFQREKKKPR